MRKMLLLLLAVTSVSFSFPALNPQAEPSANRIVDELMASIILGPWPDYQPELSLNEIKQMLQKEPSKLNPEVINKVLTTLKCAREYSVEHNNILAVIDYSLPSSEKRLWVFDLNDKKLLFHTYVSHGIKSGTLLSKYFSNKYDSKASSIGVYTTEKTYYGREGLSLRLQGLDKGFNDNASNRSVVMHGGWYMDENFIKKYGRPGRSWGCPALPLDLAKPIINTIKDKSLFVIYYPYDNWFLKSKFLHCENLASSQEVDTLGAAVLPLMEENEHREEILFADINKNNKREENEPVVVVAADNYERIFHIKAPVGRMLRRQINNMEYVALSNAEFISMVNNNNSDANGNKNDLNDVYFVIPVVKMLRGYYETHMVIVNLGKIKEVRFNQNSTDKIESSTNYTAYFEEKPFVNLRTTNRFIRWLGL